MTEAAFTWMSYSVRRSDKEPLLSFITTGLEMRGCRVKYASAPDKAPFYIVFESPGGERHGVLAYAFFANMRLTRNRPQDEHRFQIKYGGDLTRSLEIAIDSHELITTIFIGIDPERGIFVAADPLMNNPSPMSRSVEFKSDHVQSIFDAGWTAWQRERDRPKTKTRPAFNTDLRTEVLIGGKQHHLLDLIILERIGRGLDPGERHLLADRLLKRPDKHTVEAALSHRLLDELELPPEALLDLIDGASRLKMAVRGWVAEEKLVQALQQVPGVSHCRRIEAEGQPDIEVRWQGGPPILIECKNVLRKPDSEGHAIVDFQRTRASKGDPCSRYYRPQDFAVLAACLHARTEQWQFSYAVTQELQSHPKCKGRLGTRVVVASPLFTRDPEMVFSKCSNPAR